MKNLNPTIITDKKTKQLLSDAIKLRQRTETRKIKFKKNDEHIKSGDTSFYHNLDITVELDKMIKYLLAKSSKNDIGVETSNTFDNNLKSPYADFWSEVFVHWERSDGTSEIIRKEIEFVPDSGTHDEIIRFNRFFNINQLIDTNNNRITNDNKILNAVKEDTDEFRSPFVLSLSSYDNDLNKHSKDFSDNLIPGAGIGGIIIMPECYGYYSNIHNGSSSNENINTKTYFRTNDIEKEFNFEKSDVRDKRNSAYIVPAALIGKQFNFPSQYEPKLFLTNKSVLLRKVENTGGSGEPKLEENNILSESLKNEDKSFNNQYLKFFDRKLVKSRVDYIQKFIDYYTNTTDKLKLFTEDKTNLFRSKPIILRPRTDSTFDTAGRISIRFELDIRNAVSNGYVSGITEYNSGSLSNWKLDPNNSGESYVDQSFIRYN